MNEGFKKHYEEALAEASKLFVGVKNDGYNSGGVDIRDYWSYGGVRDIAYMCHAKATRLISLSSTGKKVNDCGIEDTCVDLINYAAFAFAEARMRAAERDKDSKELTLPLSLSVKNKLKDSFMHSLTGAQGVRQAVLRSTTFRERITKQHDGSTFERCWLCGPNDLLSVGEIFIELHSEAMTINLCRKHFDVNQPIIAREELANAN